MEFFSHIFPPQLTGETKDEYMDKLKQLQDVYLNPNDPEFIYLRSDTVSFKFELNGNLSIVDTKPRAMLSKLCPSKRNGLSQVPPISIGGIQMHQASSTLHSSHTTSQTHRWP